MRLSHAKLQALKGKTIDFAEFVLGSKNVTDKKMHVFLTKQLDGTHIAEMSEDPTYIFFYPNTSSTFAPAAMVNRNTYANVSTTPIVNATDVNSLLSTIYYADTKEPYVSLYLKTKLDESTRELNVKLYVLPHKTVPHNSSIFNVYLVQDGIEARQASGGDNYIHKTHLPRNGDGQRMGTPGEGHQSGSAAFVGENHHHTREHPLYLLCRRN